MCIVNAMCDSIFNPSKDLALINKFTKPISHITIEVALYKVSDEHIKQFEGEKVKWKSIYL